MASVIHRSQRTASPVAGRGTPTAQLDRLFEVVLSSPAGAAVPPALRERRRERAIGIATSDGYGSAGPHLALLGLASDLLADAAVDLAARPDLIIQLAEQIEAEVGVGRIALGRELLRAPQLMDLPTDLALEVELVLLASFAGVHAASLSALTLTGSLEHIAHHRAEELSEGGLTRVAGALLRAGTAAPGQSERHTWLWIERPFDTPAALIVHGLPSGPDARLDLLHAAAPPVGILLARMRSDLGDSEESVLAAVQRRLARLRFDLHDGPQQDVHLLATDLNLFRSQLTPMIADHPQYDRIVGRLDDLAAELVGLDSDLRRLATSFQSPFLNPGSFPDRLQEIIDAFAARSGIGMHVSLTGDTKDLTESQRLTLLALVREALTNVREHSGARNVWVTIESGPDGVQAEIVDDGRGFDPDTVLVQAVRRGHLGLVGMHERVRMLGGDARIESSPGGRTVVSATLPPWRPGGDPAAR